MPRAKKSAALGLIAVIFLPVLASKSAQGEDEIPAERLCPYLVIRGRIEPELSDTEKKNICGDEGAWKTIPFNQARYNLKNFLQDRGYNHPVFTQVARPGAASTQPGEYVVDIGQPTKASSLSARGALSVIEELELQRKRRVVGETLTPKLLDTVEQWVNQRLGALGYPCPQVTTQADPETGEIVVDVDPGKQQILTSVTEEAIPGTRHGIIRRYDAFRLGDPYNGDLLTVTSNRITSLNLLQATYFTTSCEPGPTEGAGAGGVAVHQEATAGPPRLLTFGVGVDTQGLFRLRASWRNARVGNQASFAQVQGQFSTKDQTVNALYNWYHLPFPSRRYIQPSYRLQHQNQNAYEIILNRGALMQAWTYDGGGVGAEFFVGPATELVRTLRGSGKDNPNTHFLNLEAGVRMRSHNFEYWQTDPRAGWTLQFVADFARKGWVSTASAQRFSLVGEWLYNYRQYDPPLWIFGLRGGMQTTVSPERPGSGSRLPASYYWYLGGSTDLRGFPLQSLPEGGAMTAFYLDPELRFTDLPLFGVQPFVFCDFGLVGREPASFDSPLLYSPGIGLRYKAPFGVFRTTLARGYPLTPPGGWNFFFSLGEEF